LKGSNFRVGSAQTILLICTMKTIASIIALLLIIGQSTGFCSGSDSLQSEPTRKSYTTTLIARTHSMGFFSYVGRLATDNPAIDLYFNYTYRQRWGFQVFKAMDLYDTHSGNNFALALGFRHFHVSPRLTITPYSGILLEQAHSVADHGSDVAGMLMTSYKLTPHLTVEHAAILPSLLIVHDTDWINRLRLMYTQNHIDLTLWTWHNNGVIDDAAYESSGISFFYSRIPLADRLQLSTGITGVMMLYRSSEETAPRKNGILFSIAVTWH
jgi:hypothetical protein